MEIGTIVTPNGVDQNHETIIGIVYADDGDTFVSVMWMSSQRGVFVCDESVGDLIEAPERDVDDMGDFPIDHVDLANVLVQRILP